MTKAVDVVREIFDNAGITINGPDPWDIRVHDERFYPRLLAQKSLGLGESYMEGWWDCERIDEFIHRLEASGAEGKVRGGFKLLLAGLPVLLFNLQNRKRSKIVAERHYDLGNDLFSAFLDPHLQYSCGYFKEDGDLCRAQENKMRLICDKLGLAPGQTLLDIGCGWGGLARFAAMHYGVGVTGVNISKQQIAFARENCRGLDVDIRKQDYRAIHESLDQLFDKVVSVGMFEHVGPRNYDRFFNAVARSIKPGGVFLLHTIGTNRTRRRADPWMDKYIFPNGKLPTVDQTIRAAEGRFVLEDLHNLGPHYDTTLMCWLENFRRAWPGLAGKYGPTFRRMWEYYLQCCAGAFRARTIQLWQMVFTTEGAPQPRCRLA